MDYGKSPKDDHYASILMELTLQYATLTDAHTFLLIETGTSRKFAGKRHLTDLFKRGELKPCGKDTEITVDTSLSQMVEVKCEDEQNEENEDKKDSDKESSVSSDLGSLPRRHIGELPSERRERMRNERKTYNKLVNMSNKTEDSFGTFLMEALMKFSCMNDANIFFLIETNHGRRFTGETQLCEQYLEGRLMPTGDDIEMKIDASIKVVTERRIAKPKEDEREAEESAKSARIKRGEDVVDEEVESSDRKRKESGGSMDSSDQPAKRRQAHVGMLPSERREKARLKREAELAALQALRAPPPPPPPSRPSAQSSGTSDSGRKHKGELPSERRERMRLEREAADICLGSEGKVQSGPGYICGPSSYTSGYGDTSAVGGYGEAAYGWGGTSGGYDASSAYGYDKEYVTDHYGYKSSFVDWKSGGTIQNGEKSSKSQSQYGW